MFAGCYAAIVTPSDPLPRSSRRGRVAVGQAPGTVVVVVVVTETTVDVVDVEVVVDVVEAVVHAPHRLPKPATTPPTAAQACSLLVMRARALVQSASVAQPSQALLLHAPALQCPPAVVQHRTAPGLPQVEIAAQRFIRIAVPARQPALRIALPWRATQLT